MKFVAGLRLAVATSALLLAAPPASATIIHKGFVATLQTGPLAGTVFPGTFSYDDSTLTGVGTEYLGLTSLNFTLKGVAFTRFDIDQGGQAIFDNGALWYFTAAIFPPTPWPAPVSDIAFGFGGPGVIGYISGANDFGLGQYVIGAAELPEPGTLFGFAFGVLVLFGAARRRALPPR